MKHQTSVTCVIFAHKNDSENT